MLSAAYPGSVPEQGIRDAASCRHWRYRGNGCCRGNCLGGNGHHLGGRGRKNLSKPGRRRPAFDLAGCHGGPFSSHRGTLARTSGSGMKPVKDMLMENWGLKLTAIFLAFMLWVAVHGDPGVERIISV